MARRCLTLHGEGPKRMSVWVKTCGIAREEDARLAVELGANALGFIMHEKSPRRCSPDLASRMIRSLPREVISVGVWLDEDADAIRSQTKAIGCDCVQSYDLAVSAKLHECGFDVLPAVAGAKREVLPGLERARSMGFQQVVIDF